MTLYKYDSLGNLVETRDPKSNRTLISYADQWDSASGSCVVGSGGTFAYPTSITPGYGASPALAATSRYSKCTGAATSVTDPNSKTVSYDYTDPLLRLMKVTNPDSTTPVVQYTYTPYAGGSTHASVTAQTLHSGTSTSTSTTTFDGLGRTMTAQTVGGDYVAYGYAFDATNHLSYQSFSAPYASGGTAQNPSFSYADPLGRTIRTLAVDGSTSTATYAANCATTVDPAGITKKTCSDALGRLQTVYEDPAGVNQVTTYLYNALDNLIASCQGAVFNASTCPTGGQLRTFGYDSIGRMTSNTTPEAGTVSYSYINPGNTLCAGDSSSPCKKTDANGTTVTYSYDAYNRLTGKTYGGSSIGTATPAVNYYYDQSSYNSPTLANGLGRRTGMSDGSGQTAWDYDPVGRVSHIQKTINGTTKTAYYTYNPDSGVYNLQYFSGSNVTYSYNTLGFPTSAVDVPNGFNFATNASYYDNGQLWSVVQGKTSSFAGITTTNTLNSRYQPLTRTTTTPTQTISNLTYSYGSTNNNGNLLGVQDQLDISRSVTYQYDTLSRLSLARAGSWGDSYVYDSFNSLTQKNPIPGLGGESLTVRVNPATNRVNSITYDAAGQVTLDNIGNTWTYDAEGHPKTVGGSTYLYDGDGNRVMKSGTNARMYWPGPDGKVLNESDTAGNILIRNVYMNGELVARRESNGNIHYPSLDHLGSARMVMSATGAVEDDLDYYPFGGQIIHASSSGNLYQFTGDETDTESSSLHTAYRQLSPSLGRWLRADPYDGSYDLSNPQSLNRYGYVLNNPLKYVDPTGLNYVVCTTWSWTTANGTTEGMDCEFIEEAGAGGVGSGSGGDDQSGATATASQNNSQQIQVQTKQCVSSFYTSKVGQAVKFGSPLALLPVWNPEWGNTWKEWGVAIVGKLGGLFGSGAMSGTTELTTLRRTVSVGSKIEITANSGIALAEKAAKPLMAAATVADIMAHGTCAMMSDPSTATAALQSVP